MGNQISEFTAPAGDQVQLAASVYPLSPDGETYEITWTSSDESVCTVDKTGLVTGQGGGGKAVVTATCYGISASVTVYSR
ncbi:MAG: Ig-like domain-containing protein [Oscillospiraceae bacterium]|nr:Ig-like domain-containing protein [Oscillospiraceae bacterium]